MSRMSEFNSKFGGGARQLRCQGFDTFLHTLILAPLKIKYKVFRSNEFQNVVCELFRQQSSQLTIRQ